jgi:hypothetical protein
MPLSVFVIGSLVGHARRHDPGARGKWRSRVPTPRPLRIGVIDRHGGGKRRRSWLVEFIAAISA